MALQNKILMSSVPVVSRISPMLAVSDIQETVDFYSELLGFTASMMSTDYAVIERDHQTVHLMKASDEHVMDCVRGHTQIYIEVSDILSLWSKVKLHKDRFKIRDLFDQPYGMREFHIEDPNSCLVFVGQPIDIDT